MKTGAVVCARLKSTRLPNKMLADINGEPLLWHVANRLSACSMVNEIIIATTTEDNEIKQYCDENDIKCFQGDDHDILGRIYNAVKQYDIDVVIRVWGDCPLPSPVLIDSMVCVFLSNPVQYLYTKNYPTGQNIAILPVEMLESWNTELTDTEHRHWFHVWCTEQKGAITKVSPVDHSKINLCVDTQEDLDRIREIMKPMILRIGKRRFASYWSAGEVEIVDD